MKKQKNFAIYVKRILRLKILFNVKIVKKCFVTLVQNEDTIELVHFQTLYFQEFEEAH